jgi:Flp pilus assembly protein TadD
MVGRLMQIGELLRQGSSSAVIAHCDALLKERPEDPQVLRFLGLAHLQLDDVIEAEKHLARAMHLAPEDPALMNALGLVRLKQRSYEEAARLFARCLGLRPHDPDALGNLAAAFTSMRQPNQARACLERLTRILPYSAQAHARASENRLMLSELEEAIRHGRKAVRLAPDSAAARLALADALEAAGRFMQAKYQYLAVLGEDAASPAALSGLLSLKGTHLPERYVSGARRRLHSVDLRDPERVQLNLALAQYLDQRGEYRDAFEHLTAGNLIRFRNHAFDSAAFSHAVDRLIASCTASVLRALPARDMPAGRPIFIVGMPRSGTTLVEQILASHSRVRPGGELPTIISIARQISGRGTTYPEALRELDRDSLALLTRQYLDKLDTVAAGDFRVTDKMPINFMHLGLIVALFPNATIIHCRRGALDTCLSCYFTGFNEQLQFASNLQALGRYWLDYRRLMHHWKAVLPVASFDVEYEQMVADTEATVRDLLSFCGLEWEPACLEFYRTSRGVRTPSRWQVRQPIYRGSIGRWRNYEQQLQPLRGLLASFGHEAEGAPSSSG